MTAPIELRGIKGHASRVCKSMDSRLLLNSDGLPRIARRKAICICEKRNALVSSTIALQIMFVLLCLLPFAGSNSDLAEHGSEFGQGEAVLCVGLIRAAEKELLALVYFGSIGVADLLIPLGVERASHPLSPEPRAINGKGFSLEEGLRFHL